MDTVPMSVAGRPAFYARTAEPDVPLLATDAFCVGSFHAPLDHPTFCTLGSPMTMPHAVLPLEAVEIVPRDSGVPVVADATRAVLYRTGARYDRARISSLGDHCLWIAMRPRGSRLLSPATRRFLLGPADAPAVRAVELSPRAVELTERMYAVLFARGAAADPARALRAARDLLAHVDARPQQVRDTPARTQATDVALDVDRLTAVLRYDPWTVGEVASRVGVSTSYLSRCYRRATGTTVHRRIMTARMRAAAALLLNGRLDVTTIALQLGFSSHSHFTRAFRSWASQSPTSFRRAAACR